MYPSTVLTVLRYTSCYFFF